MIALEVVGALAAIAGTALVFHIVMSLDRATSPAPIATPEPVSSPSQARPQHQQAA